MKLMNASDNVFTNIVSEEFRVYVFPNGGGNVKIENPMWLSVSKSGGHRILDGDGFCHYIPPSWIHLWWKVKDNEPHFVK